MSQAAQTENENYSGLDYFQCAPDRGYKRKQPLATCANIFYLLFLHRELLCMLYATNEVLDTKWTMKDVLKQTYFEEILATTSATPKESFVARVVKYINKHDPDLLLFWMFVGYTYIRSGNSKDVPKSIYSTWASKIYFTYCYFCARGQIISTTKDNEENLTPTGIGT